MNEPLLVIDTLEKRFGETAVLRGVTAMVQRGAITAFIGPNGSGKTTLFHAISGDLHPDGGTVAFEGRMLTGMPPWKIARLGLGKMFQDIRLFANLTILENVLLAVHDHSDRSLPASLIQAPFRARLAAQEKEQAEAWLDMVGVEEPWDRPAALLSFGNQKLLAIARLVAGRFRLLLLDEPTAGLAPTMTEKIGDLLRKLVDEEGVSIALIEHNFFFVREVASYAYLLRAGEIIDSGTVSEVLQKEENREVLIGL